MPPKTFSCPEGEVEGHGADCSGTNGQSESGMWYVPLPRRGRLARRSLDGAHISRHERRAGEIGPHDPQARMKASSLVARPRTSSVSGRAIEPVTLIDPPAARTVNSGSPSVTVARSSVPAVI